MTQDSSGGSRPVPDPTELTTKNLQREIQSLRELLETRIEAIADTMADRKAQFDTTPDLIREHVTHLRELVEEKFIGVGRQFAGNEVALNAALLAAKEAVKEQNTSNNTAIMKSEGATNRQIEQLGTLIKTTSDGLIDKIDDLKDRLTLIEGKGAGFQASWAIVIAVVMVAIGGFGIYLSRPHMPEPVYQAAPPAYYPPPTK